MEPEAAGLFAQVIPTLIIAVFLGKIRWGCANKFIAATLVIAASLAMFTDFALIYSVAFDQRTHESVRISELTVCGILVALIVYSIFVAIKDSRENEKSQNQPNPGNAH